MATGNPVPRTSPDFTIPQMLAIGTFKTVSERALARVPAVGNGTLRSGVIKLVAAGVTYQAGKNASGAAKQFVNIASTAWTIDGVEDVIAGLIRMYQSRVGNSSDNSAFVGAPAMAAI